MDGSTCDSSLSTVPVAYRSLNYTMLRTSWRKQVSFKKITHVSIARVIPSCRLHLKLLSIFVFHILTMVVLQLLYPYMKRKVLACRDLRDT